MKKYFTSQDARALINIYNFAIFPIHGVKEDGTCTCNNPSCHSIGKHPATPDGFKSASKDIEHVKRLWASRNGLNVGIATGESSGFFVVDCDTEQAYRDLKEKITLPNTLTVKTGRGFHLYFKWDTTRPIKNGTHVIDNIDIRGEGGYVAGVGSHHLNGTIYEYINPIEEIAQAPEELYELINTPKKRELAPLNITPSINLRISDGWTHEDVKEHLSFISPDCDYDTWVKIGMALHEEGVPFNIFDEWSRGGAKYDGTTALKWKSFSKGGGVSYGTVVSFAKEGGWNKKNVTPTYNTQLPAKKETTQDEINKEPSIITQMGYTKASDIKLSLKDNYLIKDVLGSNELSVIYGESNCGKTFFMLDIALHIARGASWNEKEVRKGSVMYAALEGTRGFRNRFHAHCNHYDVDKAALPFASLNNSLNFYEDNQNISAFIDMMKLYQDDVGYDPALIVIDTLSRAMGGGDENSGQDMGLLVKYADLIKKETSAHISFVHHSGKNKALGARGHSSLRAAVDTEIEISREEDATQSLIKFVKQREIEMVDNMAFGLHKVSLGVDGLNEITSCVVIPELVETISETTSLSAHEEFIMDSIIFAIDIHGINKNVLKGNAPYKVINYEEFYKVLEERGYKELHSKDDEITTKNIKSATNNVRMRLKKKGRIGYDTNYIWLIS